MCPVRSRGGGLDPKAVVIASALLVAVLSILFLLLLLLLRLLLLLLLTTITINYYYYHCYYYCYYGLDPKADLAKEVAFILNKGEHWFALRRIGREWFDLNSCLPRPQHHSHDTLRELVALAVSEGYGVFVVRGDYPPCPLEGEPSRLREAVRGCGGPPEGFSAFSCEGVRLDSAAARGPAPPAPAEPQGAPDLAAAEQVVIDNGISICVV